MNQTTIDTIGTIVRLSLLNILSALCSYRYSSCHAFLLVNHFNVTFSQYQSVGLKHVRKSISHFEYQSIFHIKLLTEKKITNSLK